ncbi:hypothetical protein Tco_0703086 [Tanacetum coccineum]|uniref:Uncharacterized protein n=1 Tax=Tanacetum coccineum TaxID=301880 RepID=A0ABQ4XXU6_9ASTR
MKKLYQKSSFFFISGNDKKCKNGQKPIIIVMVVSHHDHIVHSTNTAPTPALVGVAMAPSAMLQGFDGHGIRAPAPAPTSSVAFIGLEASLRLNIGLGLIWL